MGIHGVFGCPPGSEVCLWKARLPPTKSGGNAPWGQELFQRIKGWVPSFPVGDGWLLNRHKTLQNLQLNGSWFGNVCRKWQTMSLFDLFSFFHYPFSYLPYFFSAMMISKNLRKSVLDWFSILFLIPRPLSLWGNPPSRRMGSDGSCRMVCAELQLGPESGGAAVGSKMGNACDEWRCLNIRYQTPMEHETSWTFLSYPFSNSTFWCIRYMVYRYTALSCTPNCRNLIHQKLGIDQWRIHGNGSSWKLGIPQHPH